MCIVVCCMCVWVCVFVGYFLCRLHESLQILQFYIVNKSTPVDVHTCVRYLTRCEIRSPLVRVRVCPLPHIHTRNKRSKKTGNTMCDQMNIIERCFRHSSDTTILPLLRVLIALPLLYEIEINLFLSYIDFKNERRER